MESSHMSKLTNERFRKGYILYSSYNEMPIHSTDPSTQIQPFIRIIGDTTLLEPEI